MMTKFFLSLSTTAALLTGLTAAERLSDQLNAASTPSSGNWLDVALYQDMLILADDGRGVDQLYRIDTAHAYTWFDNPHADGMTLSVGDPHDFYLWPESLDLPGHLTDGSLKVQVTDGSLKVRDQSIAITSGLFAGPGVQKAELATNTKYGMIGNGLGALTVLPTAFAPTDGFIISNMDWLSTVQSPAIHLYARQNHTSNPGVLRFGGSRPTEHIALNITTDAKAECWSMSPIQPLPNQNVTSFRYSIQVDLITHNGAGLHWPFVNPQGYQIDTMYPFIQMLDVDSVGQMLGNFTPPGHFDNDGMAVVACNARFNGSTEVVIDNNRFLINPVDMVVHQYALNSNGRCFSAFQQQQTQGLYKLGWPFLFNVGVTFDFQNMLHNITSRPYYPE